MVKHEELEDLYGPLAAHREHNPGRAYHTAWQSHGFPLGTPCVSHCLPRLLASHEFTHPAGWTQRPLFR